MNQKKSLQVQIISSIEELLNISDAWDDLFFRSNVCFPNSRAHLLALWLEYKDPGNGFQAIIIKEANDKFVAALPLTSNTFKHTFKVAHLATSHEQRGGDFLFDPNCDKENVVDLIIATLINSTFSFFSFDCIALKGLGWQEFIAGIKRANLLMDISENYQIGQVDLKSDWPSYEQTFSKKYLRDLYSKVKRLAKEGETTFEFFSNINPSEVTPLLLKGFEVEDKCWKGDKGTSVLKTNGLFDYLCKEATYLANHGLLVLLFLIHKDKPIAFSYCHYSKGVHIAVKIGYDSSYAKFGPGQQLTMNYLKHLHNLPGKNSVLDFNGPLTPWTGKWSTHTYQVGRVFFSNNRFPEQQLFSTKLLLKPYLVKLKLLLKPYLSKLRKT